MDLIFICIFSSLLGAIVGLLFAIVRLLLDIKFLMKGRQLNMNEIIGVRRTEGTSKKTGKPFSGYIVFYQYTQQGVSGMACDNVFVSDELLTGTIPAPGMKCELRYNRNGFLTDFILM